MNEQERIAAFKQWVEEQLAWGERHYGCALLPVLQTEPLNKQRLLVGVGLDVVPLPNWTPPPDGKA